MCVSIYLYIYQNNNIIRKGSQPNGKAIDCEGRGVEFESRSTHKEIALHGCHYSIKRGKEGIFQGCSFWVLAVHHF